ncbi:MAG: hypothetical protein DRI84_06315 [Bacteroidetes bacterium]|nr:MAG: hypothetical protein DRI84_06315 [Bacteroidota bacterium]
MYNNYLKFGLLIAVLFMMASCNQGNQDQLSGDLVNNPISADGSGDINSLPKFQFVTTDHDFGKLIDGVKVSFKFKFKNIGGSDLIISQIKTSCGCTATSFSKDPVAPGGSGIVELTFDSSHQPGMNFKNATIIANTQPNIVELKIRAEVVQADKF